MRTPAPHRPVNTQSSHLEHYVTHSFQDLEHYYKSHGYTKPKPDVSPSSAPESPSADTSVPKSGTGFEFSVADALKTEPDSTPEIRCPISPSQVSPSPNPPFKNPFTGRDAPKNQRKIVILDQWVEIYIDENGKTVTKLYPSNEDLIKEGHTMDPPPELVYRRLHFLGPIPPEYGWATKSPERLANGGMATQRMTVETWLETIAREKENGTGHIGRCGKPSRAPKNTANATAPPVPAPTQNKLRADR